MRMSKVRILGPRERLADTLRVLQDFGLMQVAEPAERIGLETLPVTARESRRRRQLLRIVDDAQSALDLLGVRQPLLALLRQSLSWRDWPVSLDAQSSPSRAWSLPRQKWPRRARSFSAIEICSMPSPPNCDNFHNHRMS
ncbi:MAG: hypothetical protein AB1762_00585 [Gemmatimonadota bacterium]